MAKKERKNQQLIGISKDEPITEEEHGTFHRKMFFAPNVTGNEFLTVFIASLPSGTRGPVHKHAGEEFVYTLKGELEIEIDKKKYRAGPGTFSLIPSNKEHPAKVVSAEDWVGICVVCDRCRLITECTNLKFETEAEIKETKK